MTDGINGIRPGQGVRNVKGELKAREQQRPEPPANQPAAPERSRDLTIKSVDEALGQARGEFRSSANKLASVLNQKEESIEEARQVVQAERRLARELKAAIREGDDRDVQDTKMELLSIRDRRNEVARKIEQENVRLAAEGEQMVRLGTVAREPISAPPVFFEPAPQANLDSGNDLGAYIEGLGADRRSLTRQRSELQEVREELVSAVQEGEARLAQIESGALRSYDEAAKAVKAVVEEIRKGSGTDIHKVSEQAVRALFQ